MCQQLPLDGLHSQGAFGIAQSWRLLFDHRGADALLQVLLPALQRDQLLVGRAVVLEPIAPPPLAVAEHLQRRKPAGTVKVQIRIEIGPVEALQIPGVLSRDRLVADVLAHYGAIFALHQGVVGGAMRPRLGELADQQLGEQLLDSIVEKLRTVVGMKATNAEGELLQDGLSNGDEMGFRDRLLRGF